MAGEFAQEVQRLLDGTLPGERSIVADEFQDRFVVRPAVTSDSPTASNPLPVYANGAVCARLSMLFRCRLDRSGKYLAVEQSAFTLSTSRGKPLVRLEFDQDQAPAVHWHAHGDRTDLGTLLATTGRPVPHFLHALHLPAGGTRMRPCLEDFIEFVVRDLGVDAVDRWRSVVEAGRETWRRRQVRTLVRDAPSEAAATLVALGYEVAPPATRPAENLTALRAY